MQANQVALQVLQAITEQTRTGTLIWEKDDITYHANLDDVTLQLTIVTGPGSQAVATSGKRRLFLFTDRNPSDRAELGKLKKAVREATDARITKLQSMLAKMAPNNDSQSPAHPSNTTNSPPHNRTADQPPPDGNPPGENPSDHTQGNHNQSDAEGP